MTVRDGDGVYKLTGGVCNCRDCIFGGTRPRQSYGGGSACHQPSMGIVAGSHGKPGEDRLAEYWRDSVLHTWFTAELLTVHVEEGRREVCNVRDTKDCSLPRGCHRRY